MRAYQRAGVASTFSPTFAAVLSEAGCFARHCGAELEIVHAAAFDPEKERRFRDVIRDPAEIRWIEGDAPAPAIISAVRDYRYELLIAGALHREDAGRPFTSGVARELLRSAPCDLLLVPRPVTAPQALRHLVCALEPGEIAAEFLGGVIRTLRPESVTVVVAQTPFAAAIAASRGEDPQDLDRWLEELAAFLAELGVAVDARVAASNTGYGVCDVVEGLEADLLVVQAQSGESGPLPLHMDWLYQIIPTRLLVARNRTVRSAASFSQDATR